MTGLAQSGLRRRTTSTRMNPVMGMNSQDRYAKKGVFPDGLESIRWLFPDDLLDGYPLLNVYITIWKDTPFFMGKLTISMAMFNSKLLKLPEARWSPEKSINQ